MLFRPDCRLSHIASNDCVCFLFPSFSLVDVYSHPNASVSVPVSPCVAWISLSSSLSRRAGSVAGSQASRQTGRLGEHCNITHSRTLHAHEAHINTHAHTYTHTESWRNGKREEWQTIRPSGLSCTACFFIGVWAAFSEALSLLLVPCLYACVSFRLCVVCLFFFPSVCCVPVFLFPSVCVYSYGCVFHASVYASV